MRGFAITLDAVVAISFFMFAMLIVATQTYNPRAPGGIYLKQLTLDTLTVLEKTGRIGQAIEGNTSGIYEVLQATPELACMRLFILNSTYDVVTDVTKSGCNETAGLDMQVASKPAMHMGRSYIIKSESWFHKEPD